MLSVLLRGAALNVYNSTARQHPYFDGRALLLRLHFEVEGVQRGDRGRFMEDMRPLRLNEREGPQPTLDKLRELGDERRVYYNDFTDKDLVETFLVVIEKSTNVSPYEAPLYQHVIEDLSTAAATPAFDTVVLRVRRIWQREGVSRLARFPSPTPPDSGGDGWTRRPASGGARAMALRAAYVQEAVGEWRTTGGPYRTWASRTSAGSQTAPTARDPPRQLRRDKIQRRFTSRPLDPVPAVDADPVTAPLDPDLLDISPAPGVDDASTDDDELFKPTLAMIVGEESDDEEWPAFATSPVWVPPTSRG
ncbi:hypothetical protein CYMTET_18706 [Cymbomonas tetramitiformis]|uniref:Uncharacterized protein n=1 Tax=Cymbomonas tetramitiformis TaxID=36881 RepID=A0AAE0L5N4_9CHLO|nr:hypothetical protein CYMTET_18706 [Cymbomonas tetramitiformis]